MSADAPTVPSFARRYSGFFVAAVTATYRFTLSSDDGGYLWLNGVSAPLIDDFSHVNYQHCGARPGLDSLHTLCFQSARTC